MKILYIQQHFATGAGEAGVRGYNLVRTFAERGHDVTVISGHNWRDATLAGDPARLIHERPMDGYRLVRLGIFYSNHQGFVARVWSFLAFAGLAMWEVTRRDADLVFASSTPLTVSLPAMWARIVRRIPYVLEVRDLWPDLAVEMGVLRHPIAKALCYFWERAAYRSAWRLVALAPGIKEGIVRKASVDPSRVIMIPNGSDTVHLRPTTAAGERRLPRRDGEFLLGYTGTFGPANGLDAILDAAAVLRKRATSRARFVLIGDGREKARLQRRVEDERLDNVTIVPLFAKRDYNLALAELDAGMQILKNVPGFYYGTSPNKFFDYLAVGKPVLVNYPGWMADLVNEHKCGVAVAPDDPVAFADAVDMLEGAGDRLREMGRAARALAEREFSQATILQDLVRFVESPDGNQPSIRIADSHARQGER